MSLVHGFDANKVLVPLLLDATGRTLVSARLYNASDVAIQTDAAGDLIVAGKDGAGTARILRTDANGQPMISAVDTAGSVRQIRTDTSGDLIVAGKDVAANGYALRTNNSGNLLAKSHGDDALFAVESTVRQKIGTTSLAAGTNTFDTSSPAAGKLWVITSIALNYLGTITNVFLFASIRTGGVDYYTQGVNPVISGMVYGQQGQWVLSSSDVIRFTVSGATLNDDAFLYANGYQMDA